MEWYVWLIVQNYIMLNDGYSVLYFLSNWARCYVFLLCMKKVDNGCMFMCTHVFTVFTNISMILFFKRKDYFAFKGIKFAWKEKKYLLCIPWYERIIKKSVKTGETASRIINFVYSFIPKIQSGVLCLFHWA